KKGWFYKLLLFIYISTVNNISFFKKAFDTFKMCLMNHSNIIFIIQRFFTVETFDLLNESSHKFILYFMMNVYIIWCYTCLTCISKFPPGNSFSGQFYISIIINNSWTFST